MNDNACFAIFRRREKPKQPRSNERSAYLDAAYGDDLVLRIQIERSLGSHEVGGLCRHRQRW
jgi:hypothetical protein